MNTTRFPILNEYTYLNTPSSGLLSDSLLSWRQKHDLEFYQQGSLFRENQDHLLENVKIDLAGFFNANPINTFLVPNFSFAFNTILNEIPNSNRFLELEGEYPSIHYPTVRKEAECHYIPVDEFLEERILNAIKIFKPTIFVFSLVQYINGIKLNIDFLRNLKEMHPQLLLIADGTQYCGTEILDFENSGIDILICSGYKWMLAGYGNGFVFIKDSIFANFFPHLTIAEKPIEPFYQKKNPFSFILEPGHQDTLAFGSLGKAVQAFKEINFKKETENLKVLTVLAKAALSDRDLLEPSVIKRKDHSTIFNIKGDDELYQKLKAKNILCIPRGKGIRIGFHIYNNHQDLECLLNALDNRQNTSKF